MAAIPDGCSHWFDGMFGVSWRTCCDVHDVAFINGGSLGDWWSANFALMECVNQSLWGMGYIMFIGVTVLSLGWWTWRKVKEFNEETKGGP